MYGSLKISNVHFYVPQKIFCCTLYVSMAISCWRFPNYTVCVLEDISLNIFQLHCMYSWRYLPEDIQNTFCVLEDISLKISQLHNMFPWRFPSYIVCAHVPEDFQITLCPWRYLLRFPFYIACVLEDSSMKFSQLHCMCPWRYLSEVFPVTCNSVPEVFPIPLYVSLKISPWRFPNCIVYVLFLNYIVCVLEDISLMISQLHCMCPWRYLPEDFPITLYVSLEISLWRFPNNIVIVPEDFPITLYVSLKISLWGFPNYIVWVLGDISLKISQ